MEYGYLSHARESGLFALLGVFSSRSYNTANWRKPWLLPDLNHTPRYTHVLDIFDSPTEGGVLGVLQGLCMSVALLACLRILGWRLVSVKYIASQYMERRILSTVICHCLVDSIREWSTIEHCDLR